MTLISEAPKPALDFSDLLSKEGAARRSSNIKGLLKYMSNPGMISLGGGLPHPSLFPFSTLKAVVPSRAENADDCKQEVNIQAEKTFEAVTSLSEALQYGNGCGTEPFLSIVRRITSDLHHPPYADWNVIASCGSTDAWDKCVGMLCDPGDWCIVDEWTYPAVMETVLPLGIKPLGIEMDSEGMVPEALERVLEGWDEGMKGKKPRVVYLIPTGQNPTGVTMPLTRRQSIYALAQRFNLILVEDDPYYYLQLPPFDPSSTQLAQPPIPFSYVPSLLSLDTDGRVIRLDSFSKILVPGLRCGWVTANQRFTSIIQYHIEVSSQQPSGFSQAILAQLLSENVWGMAGWKRHLEGIRDEYTRRRDHLLRAVHMHVDPQLAEYVVPSAGMFVWFRIKPLAEGRNGVTAEELFNKFIEAGCLLVPGHNFSAERFGDWNNAPYFRATYANATFEQMEVAISRFGKILKSTFVM